MRTLSTALREALTAQETGEEIAILLTIDHADLADPIRLSNHPTARVSTEPMLYKTVSRGDDYFFIPMDITLPDDVADAAPEASITVSNVGQDLISMIRSITTPATVVMEIVRVAAPDTVEIEFPTFDLTSATYDAMAVKIGLTIDAMVAEPFPSGNFDPTGFPGLFG